MTKHCCKEMEHKLKFACEIHEDQYECPDVLVNYIVKYDEYGLLIHDGGHSMISIDFCPWCGIKLPDSKRDMWFQTLASLGYDDPTNQDIPELFKSGDWYQN